DNNSQIDEKPQDGQSAKAESTLKTPDTAPKTTVTVVNASYDRYAKSTLNIRKGPGTSHQRISTLKAGQKVLVTKILSSGWSFIESNGVKGYVSSSYLLKTAPVVSVPAKPATVPQAPTTTPVTPTPTTSPTAPKPVPTSPTYSAYRMIVGGKTLPYKNGGISKGQSIIDANTGSLSTWGGAETYSGTDGKNTHFIGHNPGAFDVLLRVSNGATIIVTDGNGNPTSYTVTKIFKVDDNAYNKSDGTNYYNYMVSTRGGEVITLQTCLSSDENLIIRAEKK
ncbi:MAG: sortase, partial [Clostridium sp.]|nr:sortase [Clostridium sp.]